MQCELTDTIYGTFAYFNRFLVELQARQTSWPSFSDVCVSPYINYGTVADYSLRGVIHGSGITSLTRLEDTRGTREDSRILEDARLIGVEHDRTRSRQPLFIMKALVSFSDMSALSLFCFVSLSSSIVYCVFFASLGADLSIIRLPI